MQGREACRSAMIFPLEHGFILSIAGHYTGATIMPSVVMLEGSQLVRKDRIPNPAERRVPRCIPPQVLQYPR